jgi:hypothetical protein
MHKKMIPGFIVGYIVLNVLNFLIHSVILRETYLKLVETGMMRGEDAGTMWIYFVTSLVIAFFFTLIFSKGYEGKGVGEGVRFGLYAGLLMATPFAYDTYASMPIPYALALQWFLYMTVEYVILGVVVAAVFGKSKSATAA